MFFLIVCLLLSSNHFKIIIRKFKNFQIMKKYFLKGRQFINKKLQQLQIQTEAVDYVNQQIPSKLKQPLAVLQRNIDLQETQKYELYFKMYPTHHLSSFLLQKFKLLVGADTPSPQVILPKPPVQSIEEVFVPKYNPELQNKALLLKQVVEQYQQGYYKSNQAIVCLSVVHFHHKRGAQVQYTYPKNDASKSIQNLIVHHSMPDSSHNKNEDYNFFNFQATIKGKRRMLFGVSYFKQIKVTEQHKQKNKQLTRSYMQKAISVVSYLPLFGYLKVRIHSTVKLFFNDFDNFGLIDDAYKNLQNHLVDTWPQISINQLYIGSDLKTIINLFGPNDFYQIWKAILYQKRIVVFAHSSSSASSFILSLLTLFPGMSTFGIFSKQTSKYMQGLRQYALPLKIFSNLNFMAMSFHIQDFHLLAPFQKNKKGSFLVGTTNRLLKQHNDYGVEMLINLENCTIQKSKPPHTNWESLSKRQKNFLDELQQILQKQKTLGYSSSEDNIRNHFHSFLKQSLLKIMTGIKQFKQFVINCQNYQNQAHSKKRKSSKNIKSTDDGIQLNQEQGQNVQSERNSNKSGGKGQNDFPPVIPEQVTHIPFPQLLLSPSFQFFLQFHNQNLPQLIKGKIIPGLLIQNFKYYLKLDDRKFAVYDWNQKKLSFGKGNPKSFEGKEIRFYKHFESTDQITKKITLDEQFRHVKSIFVGIIQNSKYVKNGFYVDKTEIYQGDFKRGMKQGYGKLTNTLHKYIGTFQQDLYSGQGQLVTSKQIYVGQFKQGLRNGCGKNQSYQKGLNYDGQWVNDKPDGNGILKNQSNTQIIGVFKHGEVDEQFQVSLRYEDGRIYKGQIKNGKQNGQGFMVDKQGKLRMGQFKDGQLIKQDAQYHNQKIVQQQNLRQQNKQRNKEQQKDQKNEIQPKYEINQLLKGENIIAKKQSQINKQEQQQNKTKNISQAQNQDQPKLSTQI